MSTLSRLLAWETDQRGIDPLGRSTHRGLNSVLDNISGHRDGNRLPGSCTVTVPQLPEVRRAVAERIANASKILLTESFEGPELPKDWKAEGMWNW